MTTYVAMGDSLTAGTDPSVPRWADELARSLGGRYWNLATVGATSSSMKPSRAAIAADTWSAS